MPGTSQTTTYQSHANIKPRKHRKSSTRDKPPAPTTAKNKGARQTHTHTHTGPPLSRHLDLRLEDAGALLHDEVDVAEGHVLGLRLRVEQRHEGRRQLAAEGPARVDVGDAI